MTAPPEQNHRRGGDVTRTADAPGRLSREDFSRLSSFISGHYGIRMPAEKRLMLEARLRKRVHALGLSSYGEYVNYVTSSRDNAQEVGAMVDAVTTNKTDFFREPDHFDALRERVLPALARDGHFRNQSLRIWSVGCSTGEEVYTLAMVAAEWSEQRGGVPLQVHGTDISAQALETARRAVYPESAAEQIPQDKRRRWLLRSKDRQRAQIRISPALRSLTSFSYWNVMTDPPRAAASAHVVFFRNVLIYFAKPEQERAVTHVCRRMHRGAYLFLGHSETLLEMELPVRQIGPGIYVKEGGTRNG
jgi:chemotaxis protein methyltransferase CheR